MHDRLILAGVQVAPPPLQLMIVLPAMRSTFRARPTLYFPVAEVTVNLTLLQLQFHTLHEPGRVDPQNLPVQLSILHPWTLASSAPQTPSTTTNPEVPSLRIRTKGRVGAALPR